MNRSKTEWRFLMFLAWAGAHGRAVNPRPPAQRAVLVTGASTGDRPQGHRATGRGRFTSCLPGARKPEDLKSARGR